MQTDKETEQDRTTRQRLQNRVWAFNLERLEFNSQFPDYPITAVKIPASGMGRCEMYFFLPSFYVLEVLVECS